MEVYYTEGLTKFKATINLRSQWVSRAMLQDAKIGMFGIHFDLYILLASIYLTVVYFYCCCSFVIVYLIVRCVVPFHVLRVLRNDGMFTSPVIIIFKLVKGVFREILDGSVWGVCHLAFEATYLLFFEEIL